MFPDTPPATPNAAAQRFSALQYGKTIVLDGDHDVFGDGSVHALSTMIDPLTLGLLAQRNDGRVIPILDY